MVASNNIQQVCACVGIRDVSVKIRGSKNPMNVVKAVFEALKKQRTPELVARSRGMRVERVLDSYYGGAK